ncbi:MAG: hypothetical protein Q4P14_04795 [Methanobacteriaceae archaeon]|nr:hypothetical protein [Methanobacteriaceae archaeon]
MSKTCLYCSYWEQTRSDGMVCAKGYGHTAPDDSCDECNELIYTNGVEMGGGITYFEESSRLRTYNNWKNPKPKQYPKSNTSKSNDGKSLEWICVISFIILLIIASILSR